MKLVSKNLVFFGNECLATGSKTSAPILNSLIKDGYKIKAVVLHNEHTKSRKTKSLEVVNLAEKNNVPIFYPKKITDISFELKALKAEAGVLAAFGKIVPESIINIFPRGIINIHPSLLPLHRGPTPIESAILNGDKKTGVSIMALNKEMDAGNIYAQSELRLSGLETKQQLVDDLGNISQAMLIELLPGILGGEVIAIKQDSKKATYDKLIAKDDSFVDWGKSATKIEREIRAFLNWPNSHTTLGGINLIITKAHVISGIKPGSKPGNYEIKREDGIILVTTGSDTLCLDILKPIGKAEMSAKAFIAGYGKRLA